MIEWMVFDQIEGLPDARADLRTAHQTANLVGVWADPKKSKNLKIKDFMLQIDPKPKPPATRKSPEELAAKFSALTASITV